MSPENMHMKTWVKQVSPEGEKSFYAVFFKDQTQGWACGIDGMIIWTEDGGDNWQSVKTTPGQENLYDIGFAGNKLWAVGMNGAMAASDDGLNWHVGVKNILTYQWLMDMVPTEKGGLVIEIHLPA